MKIVICLILTIVGIAAVASAPATSTAASTEGAVTGVGVGSFPEGASLAGVDLSGFEIAAGVITGADGSASGVFHAVLTGRTLIGDARNITLEGNVTQGTATLGSGNFSGLASLDLGDGVPAVTGVPFYVETQGSSVVLTIQSTALPSAGFTDGGLDIE